MGGATGGDVQLLIRRLVQMRLANNVCSPAPVRDLSSTRQLRLEVGAREQEQCDPRKQG